jgi:hypothetical protein
MSHRYALSQWRLARAEIGWTGSREFFGVLSLYVAGLTRRREIGNGPAERQRRRDRRKLSVLAPLRENPVLGF